MLLDNENETFENPNLSCFCPQSRKHRFLTVDLLTF